MKKRHSIHLLLAAAALLLATAACTQDELADGDRLPEGQYPVEIARITIGVEGGEAQPWGAPQTRVGETGDGTGSVFSAGDRFAVQIDGEEGIYIVQDDGSIKAESPLYWSDTGDHTVTAWYPATGGTLDLGDQSQSLAYLLYGSGTGNYQTPVMLTFAHQLAKVRVTPTAAALGEVTSLQLYTYTQCTYEKGEAGQGSQEGWIEMKRCEYTENDVSFTCWEANVVPGYTITKLRANGSEERDLPTTFTPKAGVLYNITLDKGPGYIYDETTHTYFVYNAAGLKAWAEAVRSGKWSLNCTLIDDITLPTVAEGESNWTPLGYYDEANPQLIGYIGTFDGGGHTITGLTIYLPDQDYVGLFGVVGQYGTEEDRTGKVQNLTLAGVEITGKDRVGGVVGYNHSSTVTGCTVEGTVKGNGGTVGGVAGYSSGTMTACYATGTVSGVNDVGGVVGWNYGSISGCTVEGTVKGNGDEVGGVAGWNASTVTGCTVSGNVSGTNYVGGVVGGIEYSVFADGSGGYLIGSTFSGNVSGTGGVGGVVGTSYGGIIVACYATGTVSGVYEVGGVAGAFRTISSTVIACYWDSSPEAGVGNGGDSSNDVTKVDGTDVTWENAQKRMNEAIETWNADHSDAPCNWKFRVNYGPDPDPAKVPLILEPRN